MRFRRYVLSWKWSRALETGCCLPALGRAFRRGQPEMFNSDRVVQFASADFTAALYRGG